MIYQATGTREQIQPVVDQFKHDIVYGPAGSEQNPPLFLGSFRIATFDDVSSATATESAGTQLTSGGITLWSAFGPRFVVSANSSGATDPNRLFGDINASYPAQFNTFSSPSILAFQYGLPPNESADLVLDDPRNPFYGAPKNAFGGVFVDVDSPFSAYFDTYRSDYDPLDPMKGEFLHFAVPAATGSGNFSFLGVILNPGSSAWVRLRLPDLTAKGEDETDDMVAIDDLILGQAPPLPEPSSIVLLLVGGVFAWISLHYRRTQARAGSSIQALQS